MANSDKIHLHNIKILINSNDKSEKITEKVKRVKVCRVIM